MTLTSTVMTLKLFVGVHNMVENKKDHAFAYILAGIIAGSIIISVMF